jgi:hypothetical protein
MRTHGARRVAVLAVGAAWLLAGAVPAVASGDRIDLTTVDYTEVEAILAEEVAAYVNRERVDAGLAPLGLWPDAELARRANVDYVESGGEIAHRIVRSEGAAYYAAQGAQHRGEIQGGTTTPTFAQRRVWSWRHSPPHNRIMRGDGPTHMAVAVHCVPNERGTLLRLWATVQFVAADENGADTPIADTAAVDDPDDSAPGHTCRDVQAIADHDAEQEAAVALRRQQWEQLVAYWPHAAGGLVGLMLLSGLHTRRRERQVLRRRAELRAEEASLPQTRIELAEQQRREHPPR